MDSLLLLACSNRKVGHRGTLPAIEMYDGGAFRIIRKQKREGTFPQKVDIAILSAKFGLITATTRIAHYDLQMNKQRAAELQVDVQSKLRQLLSRKKYSEIYVDLGRIYLAAIDGFDLPPELMIIFAEGRIGERLARLKRWLISKR